MVELLFVASVVTPTTIPFRAVSVDRIKNELGFTPTYTFEQGIKETIDWYNSKK